MIGAEVSFGPPSDTYHPRISTCARVTFAANFKPAFQSKLRKVKVIFYIRFLKPYRVDMMRCKTVINHEVVQKLITPIYLPGSYPSDGQKVPGRFGPTGRCAVTPHFTN